MPDLNKIPCPHCGKNDLQLWSTLAPMLVKCVTCGTVNYQSYVLGYWDGFTKGQQEVTVGGHENHRVRAGERQRAG